MHPALAFFAGLAIGTLTGILIGVVLMATVPLLDDGELP